MDRKHSTSLTLISAALALSLSACAGFSDRENSMLIGTAVGGAVGAAATGNAVGTVGGAVVGGVIGNEVGKKKERDRNR